MNRSKLLNSIGVSLIVFGGKLLTYANQLPPVAQIRWSDEQPLYSQRAWEKNLLRYHAGGRVHGKDSGVWRITDVIQDSAGDDRALLCDDPTVSIRLNEGTRAFEYALGQRFLLRRVAFMNEGLEGTVELSVAATDPADGNGRWVLIARHALEAGDREQIVRFAAVDCRYVRLQFNAKTAGKIYGLGAFGIRRAAEFYDPSVPGRREEPGGSAAAAEVAEADDRLDVDELGPLVSVEVLDSSVTTSIGQSRVEMVSSAADDDTTLAARILDEDSTTAFRFAESDRAPTLVIDLGKECDCGRVSVVYDHGRRGEMKMWLADAPRAAEPARVEGRATDPGPITDGFKMKLERSFKDDQGQGRVSFNQFRRAGRYVVLQWHGEKQGDASFGVHEVAVFEHARPAGEGTASLPLRESVSATQAPEPRSGPIGGSLLPAVGRIEAPAVGPIEESPVSR